MINLQTLMNTLAQNRPLFHSEADFQHSFAWELHRSHPGLNIRLELPWIKGEKQNHLDIWAEQDGRIIAVELKYKTRALHLQMGNEQYNLRGHGAQDCGRYDFLKDAERLEQMASSYKDFIGYAILLTNDSAYWKVTGREQTAYENYRLDEGRTIQGQLTWGQATGPGTMKGREQPIILKRRYQAHWQKYSTLFTEAYGQFHYLALIID